MTRAHRPLLWLGFATFLCVLVGLSSGPDSSIGLPEALEWIRSKVTGGPIDPNVDLILGQLRAPRVLLALMVGFCLGLSGAIMQALFSNPLAEPYVTGVAAGAALGAVAAVSMGIQISIAGIDAMGIGGFLGASLVSTLVYRLARREGRLSPTTLLLIGIAIGGIAQALTSWFALQLGPNQLRTALDWLMGSLALATWTQNVSMAPALAVGLLAMAVSGRLLNVLSQGVDTAGTLGVSVVAMQRTLLLTATFLTAASVAACGIVAFVGLLAPHIARSLFGPDHRVLLPSAAALGALIVVCADVVARSALPGTELRLSVTTGILGGAFLLRAAFLGRLDR